MTSGPYRGMNAPNGQREVRVPEPLARALEARLEGTGFASLEEFLGYVLARLAESTDPTPFSEEEEQRLRERLRSLGYID
jgi:hypothetical protein